MVRLDLLTRRLRTYQNLICVREGIQYVFRCGVGELSQLLDDFRSSGLIVIPVKRAAGGPGWQRRESNGGRLGLLVLTEDESAIPVWELLDDEQRTTIVVMLARLMAWAVTMTPEGEQDDE